MGIETLRPNANGDIIEWSPSPGAPVENWENVDEAVADDDTTDCYKAGEPTSAKDLYHITNTALTTEIINKITLYIRWKRYSATYFKAYYGIKTEATEYWGDIVETEVTFGNNSKEYALNPNTSNPWTLAQLNALQIGVYVDGADQGGKITQIYVEVDYSPAAGRSFGFIIG